MRATAESAREERASSPHSTRGATDMNKTAPAAASSPTPCSVPVLASLLLAACSGSAPPGGGPTVVVVATEAPRPEPTAVAAIAGSAPSDREWRPFAQASEVAVRASSRFEGWPEDRVLDGDPATSWFSARGDSAAAGAEPFIELAFRPPLAIHRVRVLGNRETSFPTGYSVLRGRLDLVGADGRRSHRVEATATANGPARDLEVRIDPPASGVEVLRFVSLADEGDRNAYEDVALGEIVVE
jgi:hypothetical protein